MTIRPADADPPFRVSRWNILSIATAVFLPVGLIFVIVGAVLMPSALSFGSDAKTTTGTVTSSSLAGSSMGGTSSSNRTKYRTTVAYQVSGTRYTVTGTVSTRYSTGDRLKVSYRPNRPSDADIGSPKEFIIGAIVLLALGALIFVGSAIAGFFVLRQWRSRKRLLKSGIVVTGDVTGVDNDTSYTSNGQPASILRGTWTDNNGTNHPFVSKSFFPRDEVNLADVKQVRVAVLPDDPTCYLIETRAL